MKKGQKITLALLVGVPLVCGTGGFVAVETIFGGAAAERNHELDLAKREGIPTTPAELTAFIQVPENENGLAANEKLMRLLPEESKARHDIEEVGKGLGPKPEPKAIAAAEEAYPRIGEILAVAREEARYQHLDRPRDWSQGWDLLFKDLSAMKGVAKALLYDAHRRDLAGDSRGALEDIAASERFARHAGDTPILIGMLVQVAIEAMTQRAFGELIDHHSHDAAFLQAAKHVHDGFGPLGNFRRAMCGELVMARSGLSRMKSLRQLSGNQEEVQPTAPETAFFQSRLVQGAFDAKIMHHYRSLINGIPTNGDWEAADRVSKAREHEVEADHSISNSVTQILYPSFDQAAQSVGVQLAHRNLTDTALRLLLDRARTGQLPKFLPNYGASRMDPFSGSPLVYRREGDGFLLYSVGQDRIDNGGTPRGTTSSGAGWDEVLRIH